MPLYGRDVAPHRRLLGTTGLPVGLHITEVMISKAPFTPLESPSIDAADDRIRKHQLLIQGGVKTLIFLSGFTESQATFKLFSSSLPPLIDSSVFNLSFFLSKVKSHEKCALPGISTR